MTQVLLPPSSPTLEMTAPRRLRQIPANGRRLPPPFRPSSPSSSPWGTRFTNLDWSFPAAGQEQGRWAEAVRQWRSVLRGRPDFCHSLPSFQTIQETYLVVASSLAPQAVLHVLPCPRPSFSTTDSEPRPLAGRELSGDPGDPHARQPSPARFRPLWAYDYAGSGPP